MREGRPFSHDWTRNISKIFFLVFRTASLSGSGLNMNLLTTISVKRSRRELLIGMAIERGILKIILITPFLCFTFILIPVHGQFYSHAYIYTRETWTHGNQPNAFQVRGCLCWRVSLNLLCHVFFSLLTKSIGVKYWAWHWPSSTALW